MNPSPCFTGTRVEAVVLPVSIRRNAAGECVGREERRSDMPLSSLQHFKKVGFEDAQRGDACGVLRPVQVFNPTFQIQNATYGDS